MSLVVTGASGPLGRRVAELLLERVEPSRVILVTRWPEALDEFAQRGVEVRRGDFDDPRLLEEAFAGGERMLLISRDAVGRRELQNRGAIGAAAAAGVRHVVYESMLNPVEGNPAAVAPEHRATEQALRESGLGWTFLRNGLYAELEIPTGAMALVTGQLVTNAGDGRTAYVSRDDCAAAAAAVLAAGGHEGQVYEITGPVLLTKQDEAELLRQLGRRPVGVLQVNDDTFIAHLGDIGVPQSTAIVIASLGAAVRGGYLDQLSSAVEHLTGRPPRPLRDVFVERQIELMPPVG